MDQRTRTRLPVLPTLVRAAETERRATRGRLQAALSVAPHEVFTAYGSTLMRRPAQAGRVYVTDLATGAGRDLTFEEERAFWAWAPRESSILPHSWV